MSAPDKFLRLSTGDLEFMQRLIYYELDKRRRTLERGRISVEVYEANQRRVHRLQRILARVEETIEKAKRNTPAAHA